MMGLTVKNVEGKLLVDSRDVAEMVERNHADVMRDLRKIIEHLGGQSKIAESYFIESTYVNTQNKVQPCYLLTKKGCELYATRMTGEKGTLFAVTYIEKFNEMESILNSNQYQVSANRKEDFELQLLGAEYAMKLLRVDDTSKIKMLETVHIQHGVPTNHLPVYVNEEVTKSLTALLKEFEVGLSSAKANTKLIELGILEIKERLGTKGEVKEFKSLTEKGLKYGKNLINPKSPKETQPHYYTSTFKELLELITKGD